MVFFAETDNLEIGVVAILQKSKSMVNIKPASSVGQLTVCTKREVPEQLGLSPSRNDLFGLLTFVIGESRGGVGEEEIGQESTESANETRKATGAKNFQAPQVLSSDLAVHRNDYNVSVK